MNIGQLEKLNSLIKSSPILNPQERTEWLALLDLMNDKQLGELEKILVSAKEPRNGSPAAKSDAKSAGGALPNLSHIMNLPRMGSSVSTQPPKITPGTPPSLPRLHSASPPEGEKNNVLRAMPPISAASAKFNERLKSLLQERELPPAKPEVGLPDRASSRPGIPLPPQAKDKTNKSPADLLSVFKPKLPSQLPPIKAAPVVPKPPAKPPLQPKPAIAQTQENIQAPKKPATLGVWKSSEDLKDQAKALLGGDKKTAAKFSSGLGGESSVGLSFKGSPVNIPKELAKDILSRKPKISDLEGQAPPSMPAKSLPTAPVVPENFASVDELATLTNLSLNKSGAEAVAAGIKNLVKNTGYHEVVFSLEKSPLYKVYLETGLKLLTDQISFEDLPQDSPYLNRDEFEGFSDVLRQIQTS